MTGESAALRDSIAQFCAILGVGSDVEGWHKAAELMADTEAARYVISAAAMVVAARTQPVIREEIKGLRRALERYEIMHDDLTRLSGAPQCEHGQLAQSLATQAN